MNLIGLLALVIAFLIGLFFSKRGSQTDAKILDLTAKIQENKDKAATQQVDADKKVSEYEDALKKYDPNFDDDNGSGKPSA